MFLLGFPSQFTQWCEALIVQLAKRLGLVTVLQCRQ